MKAARGSGFAPIASADHARTFPLGGAPPHNDTGPVPGNIGTNVIKQPRTTNPHAIGAAMDRFFAIGTSGGLSPYLGSRASTHFVPSHQRHQP